MIQRVFARLAVAGLLASVGASADAQDAASREDLLRHQREAKAGERRAYEPGGLEKLALKVENDRVIERWLAGSDGFFPRLATLTSGSGVAFGGGYKKTRLLRRQLDFVTSAAVSHRQYWLMEAVGAMPRLGAGRAFANVYARHKDFPREPFFGLGPLAPRRDEVNFAFRETSFGGSGGVWVLPWLAVGGGIDFLSPDVGSGKNRRSPSMETRFADLAVPGLQRQPDFVRYDTFVDLNHRSPRGNPRAGGQYRVTFSRFDDLDLDAYGFHRVEVDIQQYLSFLQARRVLALRGFASFSDGLGAQEVPFYYQPTLGGSHTLRGFRTYRYRDKNALLLQAEYRWEILPALDAALFYDAGKVASRRDDINFRDLESDYGFGFRFGTIRGVFMRLDAAFGSGDGPHFYWVFSHVF